MAARQGPVGRCVSQLIAWLAVPREITLPLLSLLGAGGGQLLWHYVDSVKILAWASGMATPFCMMCATAVWTMRDRFDEGFDADDMSAQAYQRLVELITTHRVRSTFWASLTGLMALLSAVPAISNQLIGPIWHWMVLACGGAVAFAVYAYLLANYWDLQIRTFRNKQHLERKRQREMQDLLASIESTRVPPPGTGWSDGPDLTVSPRHH